MVFIGDEAPRVYTFASLMIADHIQPRCAATSNGSRRNSCAWARPAATSAPAGRAGLDGSRIGIIGLEPYPPFYFDGAVPARTLQGMTQALPKAEFVPVYKAFFRRASVKSEEELGRSVTRRHRRSHERNPASHGRPGVSEAELVAAVTATCFAMGGYTAEVLLGTGPEYGLGPPAGSTARKRPGSCAKATSCCRKSSPSTA